MKNILIIRPGEEFTVFSERTEENFGVKVLSVVGPDVTVEVETESTHINTSNGIRKGPQS